MGMDAQIPDWPSLWRRHAHLRPQALPLLVTVTQEGFDWFGLALQEPLRVLPTDVTAALCRDAAISTIRLWRRDYCTMPHGDGPEGSAIEAMLRKALFFGDDAELFTACKTVLDFRAKIASTIPPESPP